MLGCGRVGMSCAKHPKVARVNIWFGVNVKRVIKRVFRRCWLRHECLLFCEWVFNSCITDMIVANGTLASFSDSLTQPLYTICLRLCQCGGPLRQGPSTSQCDLMITILLLTIAYAVEVTSSIRLFKLTKYLKVFLVMGFFCWVFYTTSIFCLYWLLSWHFWVFGTFY